MKKVITVMNKNFLLLALLVSFVLGGCVTPVQNVALTPEQRIFKLLADLEKKPVPQLSNRRMYGTPENPTAERIEYVCRFCNNMTILRSTKDNTEEGDLFYWDFKWTLPGNRKLLEEIQKLGLDAMLDERSLCDTCRPKINPPPQFGDYYLIVWFDGKTTRTLLDYYSDLAKLTAFLEGKLVWLGWYYDERPLKPELPRIRQLLGFE